MKAPKTSVEKFSNFIHQLTVLETKLAFQRQPCLVIKAGSYLVGINFANKGLVVSADEASAQTLHSHHQCEWFWHTTIKLHSSLGVYIQLEIISNE